jgi:hypothetical protein
VSIELRKAAGKALKTLDALSAERPELDSYMEKHDVALIAEELRNAIYQWDQDLNNFVKSARRQR